MGRSQWVQQQQPGMVSLSSQDWRPLESASPAPLTPPASCQTTSTTTSVGSGLWEGDCSSSGSSSPGMSTLLGPWALPPTSPDQPLDLSAKRRSPGPSAQVPSPLRLPPLPKQFKAKPRISTVAGRRTYTEEELHAALRDIQSGKLGTRRAAVIYGIPRSTLRNKVYKLSQERRDANNGEEEDESPDEEEKEVEKVLRSPLLSLEDVMRVNKALPALPYIYQVLQGDKDAPDLVRSMIDEDRRLNGDPIKVPAFRSSPSPPKPKPTMSSEPSRSLNNNDEKKPMAQGSSQSKKGTRPKRGKYRNYDRDSLVEAVRAVQRGEMSVHRAGSYYGVPHSTLEYKVKERHLMRPRKREPKIQNSIQDEVKRKEEAEKRAAAVSAAAAAAARQRFPPPNGLPKLGMLNPALAYGPPFSFWAPPFPLSDMPRQAFTQQLLQRLENPSPLGKTPREVAESLYDAENGSFLDGIIRSTLDTGMPDGPGKPTLVDQLVRGPGLSAPPSQVPTLAAAASQVPGLAAVSTVSGLAAAASQVPGLVVATSQVPGLTNTVPPSSPSPVPSAQPAPSPSPPPKPPSPSASEDTKQS